MFRLWNSAFKEIIKCLLSDSNYQIKIDYKLIIFKSDLYTKCKELHMTFIGCIRSHSHASVTVDYMASISACFNYVQGWQNVVAIPILWLSMQLIISGEKSVNFLSVLTLDLYAYNYCWWVKSCVFVKTVDQKKNKVCRNIVYIMGGCQKIGFTLWNFIIWVCTFKNTYIP